MHSDAHRKLPERVKKINYLIHGNRFDLFCYLTVPVYIPGGPFRFLINFRIVAVSFRFLTITPQRHSSHLRGSGAGGGGGEVRRETGLGDAPTGPCPGSWLRIRAPGRSASKRPFIHCTQEETKTSKLKPSEQPPNSRQLAGRGNNKTKELVIPSQPQPPTLDRQGDLLYSDSAFLK